MLARTLLAPAFLLCASFGAHALAAPPKLVKQLEVSIDRDFRLLDPGRHVQVREQRQQAGEPDLAWQGLQLTVLDLARLEAVELRVDLKPLAAERAAMFLDGQGTERNQAGRTFSTFQPKLLRYDPEHGRSGLLLVNEPNGEGWRRRVLYVPWDPKENRLGPEVVVHEDEGARAEAYERLFTDLGPDPTGRYHYFAVLERLAGDGLVATRVRALRLDLDGRQVDWRYTLETKPGNNPSFGSWRSGFSPDGNLLLLAEYSETQDTPIEPPPEVQVVDVAKRSHFGLPILHTPYGLVVDAKNQTLLVANSMDRKLVLYDLAKRARLRDASAPSRVHKAALARDGKGAWLFPRGRSLELRALPGLKVQASYPIAKLLPGTLALDASQAVATLDGKFLVAPAADEYGFAKDQGLYVLELP